MPTMLHLFWRTLRRGRALSLFAVLAFALGIGVTTAVFTLFYGVLLKPLPFPNPDALVMVYDTQPACTTCPASYEKHLDWKTRNTVFAAMGGSTSELRVVTGLGEPERVPASRVTFSLLDVFQVRPAMGRWISEQEDTFGGPKAVVISDAYWRRALAADPNAINRVISIDGEPHPVVGVLGPEFTHRRADLFVPVARQFSAGQRGSHFLLTYARLKPGVTPAQAQREMHALGATLAREFGHNHGIDVQPYTQVVVGNVKQPLRVLMGAVSFVLLIACANIANLLLASGLARRREMAVRVALGATRWDLARQQMAEALGLAMVGGALGLLLAQWGVATFVAMADTILPRAATLRIDVTVVLFAVGVSLLTGVVCGLWPVLRLNSRSFGRDVREGGSRGSVGPVSRKFGNGLVVAEIALAFSLLVGAGLLVKNLIGLERQNTGFSTERVIAFDLAPPAARYPSADHLRAFYRQVLPQLKNVPGLDRVGATSHLPMYQFGWNGEVTLEGGNPWPKNASPLVEWRWVDPGYFHAMSIALRKGRLFDERDRAGGPRVAILSSHTAEKFWPGQDPIGRRLSRGTGQNGPQYEVIGIVDNVLTFGLTVKTGYEFYMPIEQEPFSALTVVLHTVAPDPTTVIPTARQIVARVDPTLPVSRVQTMEAVVGRSVNQPRLISSLTSLFGVLAGLLAAVGVYGVMAHNVRRERREFAVRLALGADPARVRSLVVRRGVVLGSLGIAIGIGAALLLTRVLGTMITTVQTTDPLVFTVTAVTLLAVTILAGYLPARQASKTDPMVVLRAE
jgi:putative ABC transport system permease protein